MPRTLLVMVLTLLVAAPAASAGTRADIVRDCFDDGELDGNYTESQIRGARWPPRERAVASSVSRPMPRTLLVMVLTLLVAAPAASAGTRADIVRDCFDDGELDGNYTASQIRDARNNLPADVDQYSDCRD